MKVVSAICNKIVNFITTIIIILLFISVIASFQTTFLGKKYNNFFGYTLFEIKTASMSGVLEIGDWILVEVTNDVGLNDVVTYEEDGAFITHRIIEQYKDVYITKGDSNNSKDTPINKNQIVGKLVRVLPKFGIVKKTLFNTKVLITLFITIIVACLLFGENENKRKEQISPKSKLNFKEKEKNAKLTNENKTLETKEDDIGLPEQEDDFIQNDDRKITDTILLSKITVDMSSKTLSALHKSLESTGTVEIVDEEKIIEEKKNISTKTEIPNKKILLGKNEKNIIKKGIELKENEILELVKILLEIDDMDGELRSIYNKILSIYIEAKYINQSDLEKNATISNLNNIVAERIIDFSSRLMTESKSNSNKTKITNIANAFLIINRLDNVNCDIEKVIQTNKHFNFQNQKEIIKKINKVIKKFETRISSYIKTLTSNKFELILKKIGKTNLYTTNISSNIQFNKLFSDYSIDKTYNDNVIMEDLRELQLKLLSLEIFKDMFNFTFKKKYLINLGEGIYIKEKKLKSILKNIDDIYSQGKVIILLDIKTLIMNTKVISSLVKEGYKFSVEINYNDIKEIKNIRTSLVNVTNIFIKDGELTQEEILNYIPNELEEKIIYITKSLLERPVIK